MQTNQPQKTPSSGETQPARRGRGFLLKCVLITVAIAWIGLVAASWADAAESDEYNFNWLDPEKKIYVLQNRRYTKANRLMLSAMAGPTIAGPYRTTYNIDPRLAYYFSESFGIEVFYAYNTNSDSSYYTALKEAAPNADAIVRETRSQMGALVHWAPWYAKINVFNQILYFDWYFSGGAGQVKTAYDRNRAAAASPDFVNQDLFSLFFGTGQQFYLNDRFVIRWDVTAAVYNAYIRGDAGDKSWYTNTNFGIGLGVRL